MKLREALTGEIIFTYA